MTIIIDTIDILVSKGWQEVDHDLNCWTLTLDNRRYIDIYPKGQVVDVDYRFDGKRTRRVFGTQEPDRLAELIESDGEILFSHLGFVKWPNHY